MWPFDKLWKEFVGWLWNLFSRKPKTISAPIEEMKQLGPYRENAYVGQEIVASPIVEVKKGGLWIAPTTLAPHICKAPGNNDVVGIGRVFNSINITYGSFWQCDECEKIYQCEYAYPGLMKTEEGHENTFKWVPSSLEKLEAVKDSFTRFPIPKEPR